MTKIAHPYSDKTNASETARSVTKSGHRSESDKKHVRGVSNCGKFLQKRNTSNLLYIKKKWFGRHLLPYSYFNCVRMTIYFLEVNLVGPQGKYISGKKLDVKNCDVIFSESSRLRPSQTVQPSRSRRDCPDFS